MTREELMRLAGGLEAQVRAEIESAMRTQSDAEHEAFRGLVMARIAGLTGGGDKIDALVGKLAMIAMAHVVLPIQPGMSTIPASTLQTPPRRRDAEAE